jgi:cytoskeletal protein CcmA (bactofilin family)
MKYARNRKLLDERPRAGLLASSGGMEMALFNREPASSELPVKSQTPEAQATETLASEPPAANNRVAPARQTVPARVEARAYLDQASRVSGKLDFEESAQIDGQVDGEINAKGSLTIGESAMVTAQIKAASIIVAGKVKGEIIASQRIEICPSAKVSGNLTAPKLAVHEGAILDGHCVVQADGERDDRKITVLAKEQRTVLQAAVRKQA